MTVTTRQVDAAELGEIVDGPAPRPSVKVRRRFHRLALVAAISVRRWRIHRTFPGIAGSCLVSAAAGGITNYAFPGIGLWAGLGVAGFFCLVIDNRM